MSNVHRISDRMGAVESRGGPPHDGDMEPRVAKLEETMSDVRERLARIETKADSIAEHGATKAQIEGLRADLIKWFVGTAAVMSGLAFAIARFIGN